MKIVSTERTEDYYKNIKKAALQGAIAGGVVSLGLRAFIKHRSPAYFNRAGGYHRALIYAAPAAFGTMTNMERMSSSYERLRREEEARQRAAAAGDAALAAAEPQSSALADFFAKYKYQTIVVGWLASMGGSFWLVNRSPYMTKAQKIVQARVYAQGLTVMMLLASVFLSVGSHDTAQATQAKREYSSRSWERDLDYVATANGSK